MKKKLALAFIAPIFVLGIVGALSVVPHAHGNDLNHSQHETCPVHQFALGHAHADVQAADAAVSFADFCFVFSVSKKPAYFSSHSFACLRAPPAVL